MRIFATVAAGLLVGASWTVAAADEPAVPAAQPRAADCLCVLPVGAGSVVASLEDIKGQVLVADTKGYKPLKSRADLGIGDRVLMLGDSQAVLKGGTTCRVQLGSGSMISVIAQEKKSACVAQNVRVSPAADLPLPREEVVHEEDLDLLPFLLLGAAGGGMTAIILTRGRDRDRPISP
jgi:hypothetical protein